MKHLVLGLGIFLSTVAGAAELRYSTMQPCSFWRYDFQTSSYTCSNVGMTVQFYDKYDVDRLVRDLNTKITQLESRVAALESQNP